MKLTEEDTRGDRVFFLKILTIKGPRVDGKKIVVTEASIKSCSGWDGVAARGKVGGVLGLLGTDWVLCAGWGLGLDVRVVGYRGEGRVGVAVGPMSSGKREVAVGLGVAVFGRELSRLVAPLLRVVGCQPVVGLVSRASEDSDRVELLRLKCGLGEPGGRELAREFLKRNPSTRMEHKRLNMSKRGKRKRKKEREIEERLKRMEHGPEEEKRKKGQTKPLKMKKKDQVLFDEQEAIRLQAQFDEEERIAREKEEANAALIA
ncbi:hypothetical protein Tco_0256694 [Tanacetum coccineum]